MLGRGEITHGPMLHLKDPRSSGALPDGCERRPWKLFLAVVKHALKRWPLRRAWGVLDSSHLHQRPQEVKEMDMEPPP